MSKTLITSALPYANGYIHLGHAAGAYLPADIYTRYLRLNKREVLYVCGSDEHGVAITISAEKEKTSPQNIVDKYHQANSEAFEKFGMSFNIYSRTSLPQHHETAREFFEDFLNKSYLAEKEEEQFYDSSANLFLPDRYVEGICPYCGYDKARGDQCDKCGAYYNQTELKEPKSIITGKTPEVRKTVHWYFKFNEFQSFLEEYIDSKKNTWKDNVLAQTNSWLKAGMQERAITRDLDWGVKIEGLKGVDTQKAIGKRLYVWFDAVLGYITATKIWAKENNQDWKNWWQSEDTDYIAFIGKDNIVFHTLIFPAFLYAKQENYILPTNVPANEFLNLEGEKFSKSRNWSIDLRDFLNDFPEKQYTDSLRYTLAMNFPETKDSDFTWKDFQARNNNELASIVGNFINRTIQFLYKNFDGKVPTLPNIYSDIKMDWSVFNLRCNDEDFRDRFIEKYSNNDFVLLSELNKNINLANEAISRFRFRDFLLNIMNVARAANKYFNDEEPWKRIKSDNGYATKTLFVCSQLLRSIAILFSPIIPFTTSKLYGYLGLQEAVGDAKMQIDDNIWESARLPLLNEGSQIKQAEILFKHIEDDVIKAQVEKLGIKNTNEDINTTNNNKANEEELIDISDFQKIKLKTAVILSAEKIKKSKKLLKLQVDTGDDKRQIIAGIAEHYEPEYLVGKTIIVVANLKPAKLIGEESNGMMLAASKDGDLFFVSPEQEIGAGATVK
ncbi:MAG TPA: methionine--tRNA ligase [Candidatus Kapabacteria bacterium]|nr:methionine--tRNA ligase [Candidatus Kapabacteria bacterium]